MNAKEIVSKIREEMKMDEHEFSRYASVVRTSLRSIGGFYDYEIELPCNEIGLDFDEEDIDNDSSRFGFNFDPSGRLMFHDLNRKYIPFRIKAYRRNFVKSTFNNIKSYFNF